jgi:hypothetical protein
MALQAGIEQCAGRCLDESGCDYIRGEPQSSTAPGYSDCELLECSDTLEGTGVQGDSAELRSRNCFSREQSAGVDGVGVSVGTILAAFVCALLCFSLPLCWQCSRKRTQSLAAARLAVVELDLPPLRSTLAELDPVLAEHSSQYASANQDDRADDTETRAAEGACYELSSQAMEEQATKSEAGAEAEAERERHLREKEEQQKREENERKEEHKARLRHEQKQAEKRLNEERAQQREQSERLARIEAEQAAALETERARIALAEETARQLEEARRHEHEQRAWHLEQQRLVAQEEKQRKDELAAASAREAARQRRDKRARVASRAAADQAATAAGDAAGERIKRRAQEAISAMTPRKGTARPEDSVMMALAVGTPPPPPPRPIAELILERHSDKRLMVLDSDDSTEDSPDHA